MFNLQKFEDSPQTDEHDDAELGDALEIAIETPKIGLSKDDSIKVKFEFDDMAHQHK